MHARLTLCRTRARSHSFDCHYAEKTSQALPRPQPAKLSFFWTHPPYPVKYERCVACTRRRTSPSYASVDAPSQRECNLVNLRWPRATWRSHAGGDRDLLQSPQFSGSFAWRSQAISRAREISTLKNGVS
eukprot:6185342-Pleurochrysis_carterae.AAC.2